MKSLLAGIFLLAVSATAYGQDAAFKIENLKWMSGCWQMENKEKQSMMTEMWMPLAGGSMLGVSRTVKIGKTTDYEYMRIEQNEKGIFFIAKPRVNPEETSFKLVKMDGAGAIFENAGHDFPQRVIYKQDGTNLAARIEGNNNGKAMGFDFKMAKIKCE